MEEIEKKISIITPMYNGEKYLNEMIESVINQTYKFWELIIVDDFSVDSSCDIVRKFMKKDSRIKLINQKKNMGPALARKKAIENSNGEYIAFLDCDDFWEPKKLELQIKFMKENKSLASCTSYKIISENTKVRYKPFKVINKINYKSLLKKNYLSCDTVILKKEIMNSLIIETNKKHEDYILWLSLIKKVKVVHGLELELANYRKRNNSRSSKKIENIIEIFKIYKNKEKINIFLSILYTTMYIVNGIWKYKKEKIN